MDEYIDKQAAVKMLRGEAVAKYPSTFANGLEAAADEIMKLPTANVREPIPTNADRIRSMTDEELARLHSTATACHRCEVPDCDGGHLNCYDIWLDWLKSPVGG